MGVRWPGNNVTSVFFRFETSEKMSNRSKFDSLDTENEYFLARVSNWAAPKVDFRQSALLDLKMCQKSSVNQVNFDENPLLEQPISALETNSGRFQSLMNRFSICWTFFLMPPT